MTDIDTEQTQPKRGRPVGTTKKKRLLRYVKTNVKHQADGTTTTTSIDAIRRRNTMKKIVIEY